VGFLLFALAAWGQEKYVVNGTVVDEKGRPVEAAVVLVEGTSRGLYTDSAGTFHLTLQGVASLKISFISYLAQTLLVGPDQLAPVRVTLEPAPSITCGIYHRYGSEVPLIHPPDQPDDRSQLSADDLLSPLSMQPELALLGQLPGLLLTHPGGDPNMPVDLQVQGPGSFGLTQPLIVVDGVPLVQFNKLGGGSLPGVTDGPLTTSDQAQLNFLNLQDIESIEVLRGAAAAAPYGYRAANGVIHITTKRGEAGLPQLRLRVERGVQNLPRTFEVLNTEQYTTLFQEMFANNPSAGSPLPEITPGSPFYLGDRPPFDAQQAMLNENATTEHYHLSLSGGKQASRYYLGAGYSRMESPLRGNEQLRYTFSLNSDHDITKWLRIGQSLQLGYLDTYANRSGNLVDYALDTPPWQPYADPAQPLGYAPVSLLRYDPAGPVWQFDTLPDGRTGRLYGPQTSPNHLALSNPVLQGNRFDRYRTMGSAYLEIEPIKGITLRGQYAADWYLEQQTTWAYPRELLAFQTSGRANVPDSTGVYADYGEQQLQQLNRRWEASLEVKRSLGEHAFTFQGGYQEQPFRLSLEEAESFQILTARPADQLDLLNRPRAYRPPLTLGSGNGPANNQSREQSLTYRYQGAYSQLHYRWSSHLLVDASLRYEGSGLLAPGEKWRLFPALAAAWNLDQAEFMPLFVQTNDLKLRGSWGKVGMDQGLTGEVVTITTVALEGRLANEFTFSLGYYHRRRDDAAYLVEIPSVAGPPRFAGVNGALVQNQGLQAELGLDTRLGPLRLEVNANLTTVHNRLLAWEVDRPWEPSPFRSEVGQPLSGLWGLQTAGLFRSQAEVDEWLAVNNDPGRNNKAPGDLIFVDVFGNPTQADQVAGRRVNSNPDSVINRNDQVLLGKTIPGVFGGLGINLGWKAWRLSLFFQGVGDFQRVNEARRLGESMTGFGSGNFLATTLDRWSPENPDASLPRAAMRDPGGNTRMSDRWVEDAGFIRLRQAQLSYQLPASLSQKLGNNGSLRLYLAGANLLTLTRWSGVDPENDFVPVPRSWVMGLELGL